MAIPLALSPTHPPHPTCSRPPTLPEPILSQTPPNSNSLLVVTRTPPMATPLLWGALTAYIQIPLPPVPHKLLRHPTNHSCPRNKMLHITMASSHNIDLVVTLSQTLNLSRPSPSPIPCPAVLGSSKPLLQAHYSHKQCSSLLLELEGMGTSQCPILAIPNRTHPNSMLTINE